MAPTGGQDRVWWGVADKWCKVCLSAPAVPKSSRWRPPWFALGSTLLTPYSPPKLGAYLQAPLLPCILNATPLPPAATNHDIYSAHRSSQGGLYCLSLGLSQHKVLLETQAPRQEWEARGAGPTGSPAPMSGSGRNSPCTLVLLRFEGPAWL